LACGDFTQENQMDFELPTTDLPLDAGIAFDGAGLTKPWVIDTDPSTVHLAGGKPDLQFATTQIYLGNRPIVVDFQRLVLETLKERVLRGGRPEKPDEKAFDEERLKQMGDLRPYWRYYLVLFGFGVSKCDRRLREVGLQLTYTEDPDKPVTILDYWPKSESRTVAKGQAGVILAVNVHGEFSPSDAALEPVLKIIPLPFGASIKLGGSGDVVAQLSFDLSIPVVESFGAFSSSSRWTFRRIENQQLLGQLIHTKKEVTSLRVEATLRAIYGGWFESRAAEEKVIELVPAHLREDD
jgi:hypothetical protein